MSFFIRTKKYINNNTFRYYHHYKNENYYYNQNQNQNQKKIIINLLGERRFVDTASWEIKSFAAEKSLHTANIVYEFGMLRYFIEKNKYLQFIVNRCYNMSCESVLYLNSDIIKTNKDWSPYNLYVMPKATNRFITCDYIKKCDHNNFIIYPLESSEENKRRDISLLLL